MRNIGIIAGSGQLPIEIAKICKNNCFIADLAGAAYPGYNHKSFKLGQAGAILDYFKEHKVEHIIFAGAVKRPSLSSIKVDMAGAMLLAQIMKKKSLGDDILLKIIADFIEKRGFKIMPATDILTMQNNDNLALHRPSKQDKIDIEIGFKIIEKLGELDIGQAVVVENGYALGVEAAEGTDNLIARCAILRKNLKGGVVVKAMKPTQDQRFDIPTIGPDTILRLIENNYHGIAIKKNEVIILEPEKTYELANKNKIFIWSV
jgi:UDP-2,3-diacylglucosamine hydrolase